MSESLTLSLSLSHTHTHTESSINVRKTALQPLEGKSQATAKAHGFFTIQQSQKV